MRVPANVGSPGRTRTDNRAVNPSRRSRGRTRSTTPPRAGAWWLPGQDSHRQPSAESFPGAAAEGPALTLPLWPPNVGSPGRTRTYNLAVNSRPLYQLSYRGESRTAWLPSQGSNLNWGIQSPACYRYTTRQRFCPVGIDSGAEGRTRTGTGISPQQCLRLSRLPVPPLRRPPSEWARRPVHAGTASPAPSDYRNRPPRGQTTLSCSRPLSLMISPPPPPPCCPPSDQGGMTRG